MRVLQLYRPALPGLRAQGVQVVHTGHALARRGHHVTLLADRAAPGATPEEALACLGLDPHPGFCLRLAPTGWRPGAGLWFRSAVAGWLRGTPGVVHARDKRRLVACRGLQRHRVVLETHELDSLLAQERGEDPSPWRTLEADALGLSDALVANCAGTLKAWRASGARLPATQVVVHNGTANQPVPVVVEDLDPVVRCLGSLRAYKGVEFVLGACADWSLPLEWIGGTDAERVRFSGGPARLLPPVPQPEAFALLRRARVLLVPLEDNTFGRCLTSPLKLWDALAAGRPIVAPALPSILEIKAQTGACLHLFEAGNRADLARAMAEALEAPPPSAVVRSWADRAAALEAVFVGEGSA